jgi:2-keto-4-pentenoate hydratase
VTAPASSTPDTGRLADAADRLVTASSTRRPAAPVRDLLGDDIAAGYAVQQELTRQRKSTGAAIVGRKIGLASPAVQHQLGVDQPDFGVQASCTYGTGNRMDGTRCARLIWRVVPRTVPRGRQAQVNGRNQA